MKNGKMPDKGSATLQKIQPDMNELNVSCNVCFNQLTTSLVAFEDRFEQT